MNWDIELTHIFVDQAYRKKGIGSRLMRMCIERVKAEGLPLMLCSDPTAHEFYLKRGFTDTKHADLDLAKWAPEYSGFGVFKLWEMAIAT